MEEAVKKASEIGLDFIIFGGMTLKEGKQKDYFQIPQEKWANLILVSLLALQRLFPHSLLSGCEESLI